MKKTILFFVIALLSMQFLNAQSKSFAERFQDSVRNLPAYRELDSIRQIDLKRGLLSNEEFFEKADLIIEGKMVRFIGYYDAIGNYDPDDLYAVGEFSIWKVFKGDPALACKTISLVIKGGVVYKPDPEGGMPERIATNDYSAGLDRGLYLSDINLSIQFFMTSDYPEDPDKSKAYPQQKFKPIQHKERAAIEFWGDGRMGGLNGLVFNNREELYQYMSQFNDMTIPKEIELERIPMEHSNEPFIPTRAFEGFDDLDPVLKEDIINRLRDHNPDSLSPAAREILIKYGTVLKKKLQTSPKTVATNNTLTLSMAKQKMTYVDSTKKSYFEFDIMASTNNPDLWFDAVHANIQFNASAMTIRYECSKTYPKEKPWIAAIFLPEYIS